MLHARPREATRTVGAALDLGGGGGVAALETDAFGGGLAVAFGGELLAVPAGQRGRT